MSESRKLGIRLVYALIVALAVAALACVAAGMNMSTTNNDVATCISQTGNVNNCRLETMANFRVDQGTVSDAEWSRLRQEGWSGVPGDSREALYPPVDGLSTTHACWTENKVGLPAERLCGDVYKAPWDAVDFSTKP